MAASVQAVVFINLERRPDRRQHIEGELGKVSFPQAEIRRFEAVDEKLAGCVKSHLGVLKMAVEEKWDNVLVLEDDFTWEPAALATAAQRLDRFWEDYHQEFGFVQLTRPNGVTQQAGPGLLRVHAASNAAGYWVHSRAYASLIAIWEETWPWLAKTGEHWNYMNDVTWNEVRKEFPCYNFCDPPLGFQCAGWSDLGEGMREER